MSTPGAKVKTDGKPILDIERILSKPLGEKVLGAKVCGNVYIHNGFRLLSLPASAGKNEVEECAGRLLGRMKMRGEKAIKKHAVALGYEDQAPMPVEEAEDCINKMRDPRCRIVHEFFWPHLPTEHFNAIVSSGGISSPEAVDKLESLAEKGNGDLRLMANHALAVAHHNRAIVSEIEFINGRSPWQASPWRSALGYWATTLHDDGFWDYFMKRVADFGDFRLKAEDIDTFRLTLPALVLEFNSLLAQAYSSAGHMNPCSNHMGLISDSPFAGEVRINVMRPMAQQLALRRIEPLVARMNSQVLEKKGKQQRSKFGGVVDPILREAEDVYRFLVHDLKIPDEVMQECNFDALCKLIFDASNQKLDYDTEDRMRSLLYGMLLYKRLLSLPVSTGLSRLIGQELRKNRNIIFCDEYQLPEDVDPTVCWFVGGEPADAEASLIRPVYKVTKVSGPSIYWTSREIIIPRSSLANDYHGKKISKTEIIKKRAEENKSLGGELQALEGKREEVIQPIAAKRDAAIEREQKKRDIKLAELDAKCTDEQREAIVFVEKHEAALEQKKKEAKKEYDRQKGVITKRYAGKLEKLKKAANPGDLQKWLFYYIPNAIISTFVVVLAFVWVTNSDWSDVEEDTGVFLVLIGIAVLIGILAFVKHVCIDWRLEARREILGGVEKGRNQETDAVKKAYDKEIGKYTQDFNRTTKKARDLIGKFQAERDEIKAGAEKAVTKIKESAEANIKDSTRELDRQIAEINAKLAPELKAEKEYKSFPAYSLAKNHGYKDGRKPSQSEQEQIVKREFDRFMNRLTLQQKQALAVLQQRLTNEQFNNLLVNLMQNPEKLREIEHLAILGRAFDRW